MLNSLRRRERLPPHQPLPGICLLLSIQPIRRLVLRYISAFDVAKLNLLRLLTLTSWERQRYLRPIRDLVWDIDEQEVLSREGMRLVLLGDAAHVLKHRLDEPRRYQASQGTRKRFIYLVGTFPIVPRSLQVLKRLTGFSVFGELSLARALNDERQVRQMQWALQPGELKTFLMAFGVPEAPGSGMPRGVWHKMPDVPDRTIDVRVYVPTFYDRVHEEARITSRDLLHISRLNSPSRLQWKRESMPEQWAHAMHWLCKVAAGRSALTIGILTEQGDTSMSGTLVHLNIL